MLKLFDSDFFRLFFWFVIILSISIIAFVATVKLDKYNNNKDNLTPAVHMVFSNT